MKRVLLKTISTKYYSSIFKLIVITFFTVITFSCSNDDDGKAPVVIKEISQEIKDLIYFKGDEKAPTVLINIPGGPSTEFNSDITELIYENANTTNLLTVNIHQAQTLNSSILQIDDLELEEVAGINTTTINMLHKVISYFKSEGRTVYVFGFSFGAFVTQELIAKKGINAADKYLIITGRLDMNDAVWQAAAEGKETSFESNGITPNIAIEPKEEVIERNLNRISAGLAMNRYTQLFNTIEDLSNVTYAYSTNDEAVGSLTNDEVEFLESKNVNILSGSGSHGDTFYEFLEQGFREAFGITGKI